MLCPSRIAQQEFRRAAGTYFTIICDRTRPVTTQRRQTDDPSRRSTARSGQSASLPGDQSRTASYFASWNHRLSTASRLDQSSDPSDRIVAGRVEQLTAAERSRIEQPEFYEVLKTQIARRMPRDMG